MPEGVRAGIFDRRGQPDAEFRAILALAGRAARPAGLLRPLRPSPSTPFGAPEAVQGAKGANLEAVGQLHRA